jgi:polyhydroxybutyrate depolymerase
VLLGLLGGAACAGGSGTTASVDPGSTVVGVGERGTSPGTSVAPAALPGARPSSGCRAGGATAGSLPATSGTSVPDGGVATEVRQLDVGGATRSYRLSTPAPAADAEQGSAVPRPLILVFHGFGSNAEQMAALTRMPAKGTAAGAVVAVPDGAPAGPHATWQTDGHGTDAAFVEAMIDEIRATQCIDEARIDATGFSAGAAFTLAYSCTHPQQIAAVVTVAVDFKLGCTTPLSILAFHGTADPIVPYADGAVGMALPGTKVRGTERNMADWAALDGCQPTPALETVGTEVVRHRFAGCQHDTEVVLDEIKGGNHAWPGADPAKSIGLTTQQIDASDEAIAFLARHHLGS